MEMLGIQDQVEGKARAQRQRVGRLPMNTWTEYLRYGTIREYFQEHHHPSS